MKEISRRKKINFKTVNKGKYTVIEATKINESRDRIAKSMRVIKKGK